MTEINESWGKVLELIESTIKVPRRVIELVAVKDILTLAASGVANHKIASVLDVDPFYVKSVLMEFINFPGWVSDLDLNPYSIYSNLKSRDYAGKHAEMFLDFKFEVNTISPYLNDEVLIRNAFIISERLWEMEQELEREWK